MYLVRGVLVVVAIVLATAAWGEDSSSAEDGSVASEKFLDSVNAYLGEQLLKDERFGVDREYWMAVKGKLIASIKQLIAEEDEFIQAILPIIANIRAELRELVRLTMLEMKQRTGGIDYTIFVQLRDKALLIAEQGIAQIKAMAETKSAEYKAMLAKLSETVGQAVEDPAAILAAIVLAGSSTPLYTF